MWSFAVVSIALMFTSSAVGEYFEQCSLVPEDTYIAIEDECHSYIYCGAGDDSYKDTCPEGTYFDEKLPECVIDENNICPRKLEHNEDITEEPINMEETVSDATTTAAYNEVTTEYSTTPRPVCDRHVDAYYPHHDRCEYFYKCVAGYLTISRCNFNYVWDYRHEVCVHQDKAAAACYGQAKIRKY